MEEVQARHRKELKALEGEKRAAVKKQKAMKGKKAKDVLPALQEDYTTKLQEMEQRHKEELAAFTEPQEIVEKKSEQPSVEEDINIDKEAKERKQSKARCKREQQLLKQKQLEEEQERDLEGPSARKEELHIIQTLLTPLGLEIQPVASDGHCLYRAVAEQCTDRNYLELRQLCATTLHQHEDEFSPFCECTEDIPTFVQYVERIRNSADWGGHVELRALSLALKRPIIVYSAQQSHPLEIHVEDYDGEQPIRLSYHLYYYTLGEHYNCVMPKANDDHDDDEQ